VKSILITISLSLITSIAFAQRPTGKVYEDYLKYIHEGDSLCNEKNYLEAARRYTACAALIYKGKPIHTPGSYYNATCCWALVGEIDSAFYHLNGLIKNFKHHRLNKNVEEDTTMNAMHSDPRWEVAINEIKKNAEKAKALKERNIYSGGDNEVVFYPLNERIKSYLHRDTLPFSSINHNNFRIFFRGNSVVAQNLDVFKADLTNAFHRSLSILNIPEYTRGINILILGGKEEMKELTGIGPGGGFAEPNGDFVTFNYTSRNVLFASTHELFHLISTVSWGRSNKILLEGSAVYADKGCNNIVDNSIYVFNAYMLKDRKQYTIKELLNNWDRITEDDKDEVGAYFQSAGMFKYLYERYGVVKMKQLWQKGFSHFEEIYALSLDDFEKDWHKFIETVKVPEKIDWEWIFSKGCKEYPQPIKNTNSNNE
jgi:hypothetical protein